MWADRFKLQRLPGGLATLIFVTACSYEAAPLATARPGMATEEEALLIALPLVNRGDTEASDVRISGIALADQRVIRPAELPWSVADIPAGGTEVLQLAFASEGLAPDGRYVVRVEGEARFSGSRRRFRLEREVALPPPGEGERAIRRIAVETRSVKGGGFEPVDPGVDRKAIDHYQGPPLPASLKPVSLEPHNAAVEVEHTEPNTQSSGDANEPMSFVRVGTQQVDGSAVLEPSGQSMDVVSGAGGSVTRLVVLTGNLWRLLVSTDGGATFTELDARTLFGPIPLDGLQLDVGFTGDNNLIYIPSINRYVWQLLTAGSQVGVELDENGKEKPIHGSNRLRVAMASPEQIIASGGTAWSYWDMTTALLGLADTVFLDHPSLAYSQGYLHVGVTAFNPLNPGQDDGYLVAAVPLSDVQIGGTIHIGHTFPNDSSFSYSTRLAQDCSNAAYWFGQEKDQNLWVYEWADGSDSYSWRSLSVDPWVAATEDNTISMTPEGINWLTFHTSQVRSATCRGFPKDGEGAVEAILAAWSGGRGGGFPQPYVRLQLVVKGLTTWTTPPGTEIWNPDFAFQFADLATNTNGEVGVSVAAGGGAGGEATPVAGFVGDSTLYAINVSTASDPRWGDYTAIRPHWPNDKLFSVADYYLRKPGPMQQVWLGNGFYQYRLFGRSADIGGTF